MEKCLNCPIGCKNYSIAKSENKTAWFCEEAKIWIYKNLPEGMRHCTRDDINPDGRRRIGLRYILYSEYNNHYEVYQITENTNLPELVRFIDRKFCWVKQ